jgi:hypothetical protein
MRTIIAMTTLVLAASATNAAPIYLTCPGEWVWGVIVKSKGVETITISIDFDIGTVTWSDKTWKIYRNTNNEVGAAERVTENSRGGWDVLIDRVTGDIFLQSALNNDGSWYSFSGTCKPAQKLF